MGKLYLEKLKEESKCSFCEEVKVVEPFGAYKICKDCLRREKRTFTKPKGRINLEVFEPIGDARSCYSIRTNTIKLDSRKGENLRDIILTISHETIHFILAKELGLEECYKFDGIAYKYTYLEDIAFGVIDLEWGL